MGCTGAQIYRLKLGTGLGTSSNGVPWYEMNYLISENAI